MWKIVRKENIFHPSDSVKLTNFFRSLLFAVLVEEILRKINTKTVYKRTVIVDFYDYVKLLSKDVYEIFASTSPLVFIPFLRFEYGRI